MTNESVIPTPATPDVCTVALLIDGEEISGQFQILTVAVSREINRIPSATLQLKDGEAAKATFAASNKAYFIPGKSIEIQLGYRSQNTPVFKGVIVKHSIKIRKNESLLILECRHQAVKMTGGINSRYYTDKKDSDIMEELIGLYGLANDVESTEPELKEVVQYEASDWDFLMCRAEANGHVVVVADDSLKIGKPLTGEEPVVQVRYGSTLLELDAEIDARLQSKSLKATAWNAAGQEVIEAEAAEPSAMNSGNLAHADLAEVMQDDSEIRHGGGLTLPELKAWADARLLKERLAKIRGRAKFQGFADVQPGKVIDLTGIGERFEGAVYVSGVRHTVAGGNWETDVQFGISPELFAETYQLRPLPAAGLLPAVSGLQMGVVTLLENDPDGEDRIKIRLPLVSASDEGVWARLATLDAGNQRGTFFRPEIGDEVLVGFLGDDPRYPVVLGMCHSSAKPAPESAKDDNHRKGYISREKMAFTFDDEKKVILLETPGGNRITLSEDEQAILVEDQNGNKITLDSDGITLESAKDIILKATGDVKIEGMNAEIKAQTGFKAEGSATAEISGASTTINGSASTTIKGGVVQIN
ncbi:type VI secretion system tip protein VgrG [Methylicorpusculum oleiharenae]|uniref:type VI secretion system tip protein VgrG n=1 Tax=Methylicorpusculum oleiharenae TaxID=1338687 RepID=UPI00135A0801|nr:type VI secretion system tip protein VgrG [Methylicorpusculum oleiharenae]MCD2449918.1 type VI secretion system tip protein VgrG [Methylicorpusculum oleiharenae]